MSTISLTEIISGDFLEKARADYYFSNPANGTGNGEILLCLVIRSFKNAKNIKIIPGKEMVLSLKCPICNSFHEITIPSLLARNLGDTRILTQYMMSLEDRRLIELATGVCMDCQNKFVKQNELSIA